MLCKVSKVTFSVITLRWILNLLFYPPSGWAGGQGSRPQGNPLPPSPPTPRVVPIPLGNEDGRATTEPECYEQQAYYNPGKSSNVDDCMNAFSGLENGDKPPLMAVYGDWDDQGQDPRRIDVLQRAYPGDRFDHLLVPRAYFYRTCLITIEITKKTTQDVASKAAIELAVAQILLRCVDEKSIGGQILAGRSKKIFVSVLPVAALSDSLTFLMLLKAQKDFGSDKVFRSVGDDMSPVKRIISDTSSTDQGTSSGEGIPSSPQVLLEELPNVTPTGCLDESNCGWGFTCQKEAFVGTDQSWGLPQSGIPDIWGFCRINLEFFKPLFTQSINDKI
ncbi:MAG: hypothetical protein M1827_006015 [Pycnora praestabilis]|nr:MAG: hypothetical protein M1827_006015 [Pycnora praestabilis]